MPNFDLNNHQSSNCGDDISMRLENLNTARNRGQQPFFNSGGWFLDPTSTREAVQPKDPNQVSHYINMRLRNLETVTDRKRFTL